MTIAPYRAALALPGVRALLLVTLFARIPATAVAITLTLHVSQDLQRGWGASGLVAAAATIGAAVGAPVMGRLTDRYGLRPVLVLTTVGEAVFWLGAQALSYAWLVPAAVLGGFLTLPVFSVARQSIAALVPDAQRRPAYALDAMSVELSFMLGPALAVAVATSTSGRTAMLCVGTGVVVAGIILFLLDPPIRAAHEESARDAARIPRRTWITPRMLTVFAVTTATTIVLGGTDVAVVASMKAAGQLEYSGAVIALWCCYSLLGGFAYGGLHRPVAPLLLLALLAVLTLPVGLGGSSWWLLGLAILPAGLLCAPTLTATADAVSRLAPPSVRGEATGLHGSALTIGIATGAPLAGFVMDHSSPAWGFAATGGLGLLIVLACLPVELRRRAATGPTTGPTTRPATATRPGTTAAAPGEADARSLADAENRPATTAGTAAATDARADADADPGQPRRTVSGHGPGTTVNGGGKAVTGDDSVPTSAATGSSGR
jgi:predicted MFS family arabinose efflux permease